MGPRLFIATVAMATSAAHADALEGKRGPGEIVAAAPEEAWRDVDPTQLLIMDLEAGRVAIELSDAFAQKAVAQMKTLAKAGFYDGLSFYRVIDGFVAQGGDPFEDKDLPEGAATGLKAEFDELAPAGLEESQSTWSGDGYAARVGFHEGFPVGREGDRAWLLHCAGALAFGRTNERDSSSTEFYVPLQPQRYLDRNLTVFGRVIEGMEHIQRLNRQAPPEEPSDPVGDLIMRVWMADAPPKDVEAPRYQVFRTDTNLFDELLASRRNRPEAFFYYRPNHVDICQMPIPVRETPSDDSQENSE